MKNSYDNLAPKGWAEIHILGNGLYFDDGTIDRRDPFVRLFNALAEVRKETGLSSVPDLGSLAREAGFSHVRRRPSWCLLEKFSRLAVPRLVSSS